MIEIFVAKGEFTNTAGIKTTQHWMIGWMMKYEMWKDLEVVIT